MDCTWLFLPEDIDKDIRRLVTRKRFVGSPVQSSDFIHNVERRSSYRRSSQPACRPKAHQTRVQESRFPVSTQYKEREHYELIATTAARSQAIYSQEGTAEIVWIDWWDFRSHEGTNVSCSGFFTDQAEQLIERLNRARSAVLPLPLMSRTEPAALALPQCLGYILKCECVEYNFNHRIGFLYSKPSELYWSTYSRGLCQLLESRRLLPSKLNLVLFAQRLASCISFRHVSSHF